MADEARTQRGRLTRTDLARMEGFAAPWATDRWGTQRPTFSAPIARMSAELAANVYTLDLDRWLMAGWTDCTLQRENRVLTGISSWWGSGRGLDPVRALRSEYVLTRARVMVSPYHNPIGDLIRAVRQIMTTDTGKAMVMARPMSDGRIVVAISFMGTSRKFYDWFTNFKLTNQEGLHEGFYQLARQFDQNAERITFPDAQKLLGEETLTLDDVLTEASRPDSRFVLWLTGHSQGGAVCQTYAHLLLHQRGVLPENIVSYTFAAPTVAGLTWQKNPADYPIYNIVNADDYVPRIGASVRLGQDMVFYPDDAFREKHYRFRMDDEQVVYARERMRRLLNHLQDTQGALDLVLALCRVLETHEDRAKVETLFELMQGRVRALRPALTSLGLKMEDMLKPFVSQLVAVYRDVIGVSPDEELLNRLAGDMVRYMEDLGTHAFMDNLFEAVMEPHNIYMTGRDGKLLPTYCGIVRTHLNELIPAVWAIGGGTRLLTYDGDQVLPIPERLLSEEALAALIDLAPGQPEAQQDLADGGEIVDMGQGEPPAPEDKTE